MVSWTEHSQSRRIRISPDVDAGAAVPAGIRALRGAEPNHKNDRTRHDCIRGVLPSISGLHDQDRRTKMNTENYHWGGESIEENARAPTGKRGLFLSLQKSRGRGTNAAYTARMEGEKPSPIKSFAHGRAVVPTNTDSAIQRWQAKAAPARSKKYYLRCVQLPVAIIK